MTLLVLGASSDMGMYFIKSTYQRYDKIIAHYRTMNTELNDLGEKIGRDRISLLKADLAVEEDVLALVNQIRDICDYPLILYIFLLHHVRIINFIRLAGMYFKRNTIFL